jgi:hypothetical protein
MRKVPLFGAGTAGKSYVVTRQRRLNCYFELRKDKDKTSIACYGTPGLVVSFTANAPFGLPLRGLMGTSNALYLAAYNQFQSVKADGTVITAGALATASGLLSMAFSATQVVIVDGTSAYLHTPASSAFAVIAGFTATGAKTVTFIAGFFVCEQPGTQNFFVSNAFDGSTWNALAVAAASTDSDNILAVDSLDTNLLLFMQGGMEFWQNVGSSPEPFAPVLSAANRYGLAAIFSRVHVDQTIIFLAQSETGQVQVCQVRGYSCNIISDADLENIINGFSVVSDCIGMAYQVDTHKFAQLTFPTANRSFLYDCSTQLWSEVQTGASTLPVRHTGNLSTQYAGQTLVSDWQFAIVYKLDPNTYTDNGTNNAREIITRHLLSNFNRVRISQLYLDMETGVGLQTGQGSNPQIMLQYSKDNGRTWSAERWVSSGLVGQYLSRVVWRRFGRTRDATFRIRMTDPVKFVITQGALKIREKQPAERLS